ncbi:MAG: hypothetical protein LBT68_00530 [Spirochaetales bacterium]|jgi:hypothetical protein|nr:hypothetical protein [Spirochaetales bacterium]
MTFKSSSLLTLCLAFSCAAFLSAAETVEIYTDFRAGKFGQAEERLAVKEISVNGFTSARTLAAPDPDGILTAVVLDARVVGALTSFLTDYHERRAGSAWLWLEDAGGRKIFHYYDDSQGLSFSFSAEKPDAAMLSFIEAFYRRDLSNKKDVAAHYKNNYVIRIHSAENFIDPWINSINFEEALVIATLIGDTTQELWGIRDGKGLLRNLPDLIAAKADISLQQYRPIETNEIEYLTFIRRVRDREGGFARNLRFMAMNEFDARPFYDFQLPEEFVVRGHGKPEDRVLLYTDILARMGYQTRLLAVAQDSESQNLVVVFREGERGNWSALTEKDIFPDAAADWKKIPAVIMPGENVWFHEMDFPRIFLERKVYDVPAGSWLKS